MKKVRYYGKILTKLYKYNPRKKGIHLIMDLLTIKNNDDESRILKEEQIQIKRLLKKK